MTSPPDSSAPASSAELYAACRSTDLQVQSIAYTMLWQYLCRVALQIVRDQPDPEALAQDCAQEALVRIHERLAECARPEAFHAWARRIAANAAIDELRRLRRLVPLAEEDEYEGGPSTRGAGAGAGAIRAPEPTADAGGPDQADLAELRALLQRAPISARSCRVVIGRYLDSLPDEALAEVESRLAGGSVLPSHVQVTRTKDIARLRQWEPLRTFLKPPEA